MNWLSPTLIIAVLSLLRELIKFLRERQASKREALERVKKLKIALKHARKTGDTSLVESEFNDLLS